MDETLDLAREVCWSWPLFPLTTGNLDPEGDQPDLRAANIGILPFLLTRTTVPHRKRSGKELLKPIESYTTCPTSMTTDNRPNHDIHSLTSATHPITAAAPRQR